MKSSKLASLTQRGVIGPKVASLLPLRKIVPPRLGWLKAIRGALGLSAELLGERLGMGPSSVLRFERREAIGTITLESLERVAVAMDCRLFYAILPADDFETLDAILEQRALRVAQKLVYEVEHSMALEGQESKCQDVLEGEIKKLAYELKMQLSHLLWKEN